MSFINLETRSGDGSIHFRWHQGPDLLRVKFLDDENDELCGDTLDPNQTRALFRYLGDLVLPKVERVECRLPCGPPKSSETLEPSGTVAAIAFCTNIASGSMAHAVGAQVLAEDRLWCPAAARALAACLLAAADEAEGVKR